MRISLWFLALFPGIAGGMLFPQSDYDAQLVRQVIPQTMIVGFSYSVSVTFTNTGTQPWTKADNVLLGSYNPKNNMTWGIARVELAPGEIIQPGHTKTFRFNVTAPLTPGQIDCQWCMLKEYYVWFGQPSTNVKVSVQPRNEYDARFESKQIPVTLLAGESRQVTITFKNIGSKAWKAGDLVRLGSDNPQNNLTWGIGRVDLLPIETIDPDQNKNFVFTITAPVAPGKYNCQWRMLKEFYAWFGQASPNVVVDVKAREEYDARYISQVVSSNMVTNGSYPVSIVFRNIGSKPWTRADGVKLGSLIDAPWGITRVELSESEVIVNNQEKEFKFTVIAPSSPGKYDMQWQMMKEYVKMFGQPSLKTTVDVQEDIVDPILYFRGTPGRGFENYDGNQMHVYREDAANRKFWYMKNPKDGRRWERFGWDNEYIYLERDTTWPPRDGVTPDGKVNTAYDAWPYGSFKMAKCYQWRVGDSFSGSTHICGFNFLPVANEPNAECNYEWAPKHFPAYFTRKLWAHYPHYNLGGALKDVDVIVIETTWNGDPSKGERHWFARGLGFVRFQEFTGNDVTYDIITNKNASSIPVFQDVCPDIKPPFGK